MTLEENYINSAPYIYWMYQTIVLITYPNNTTVHFKPVETADIGNFTPRTMDTQGH